MSKDGGLIPGKSMRYPKLVKRPGHGMWAPGEYMNQCRQCGDYFVGDKRAMLCGECAYNNAMLAEREKEGK